MSDETKETTISNLKSKLKISDDEFNGKSIANLADRPNVAATTGSNRLSATALKERFDANPNLLRNRFNTLIDYITEGDVSKELTIAAGITLASLYTAITDGTAASGIIKAKRNANAGVDYLDEVLAEMDGGISQNFDDITDLQSDVAGLERTSITDIKVSFSNETKILTFNILREGRNGAEKDISVNLPLLKGAVTGIEHKQENNDFILSVYKGGADSPETITIPLASLKIASVDDYIDENDGKRYLKIAFEKGRVISMEFDEIFDGIDTLLAEKANTSDMNVALADKVDKITTPKALYATNTTGGATYRVWSDGADANTIPIRTNNGTIKTKSPIDNDDATSKQYVDSAKADAIVEADKVAKRVDKLEGMLINYIEDSTEAYAKSVPTKAAPKAILNRIGGKTIKNELPREFPYTCTIATEEEGGFYVPSHIGEFLPGTYEYTLEPITDQVRLEDNIGNPITYDSHGTFKLDKKTTVYVARYFMAPTSAEVTVNITSLNIFPTKVTEIVSRGRNLAKCTAWSTASMKTPDSIPSNKNIYGTTITTTDPVDSIDVTQSEIGNASDPGHYSNGYIAYRIADRLKDGFSYTISFDIDIKSNPLNVSKMGLMGNGMGNSYANILLPASGKGRVFGTLTWLANDGSPLMNELELRCAGISFTISNVMITEPSNDITYSPYIAETYALPKAVVNDADWGISVGDKVNTYDFDSKEYSKYAKIKVYDGTEQWLQDNPMSGINFYEDTVLTSRGASVICNRFTSDDAGSIKRNNAFISGTGILNITADGYNSVEEWKAQLAQWAEEGAPLIIVYELATPKIIPITDDSYTDYKLIKVEGDGELIAKNKNETETAIPWTVTFAEV